MVRRLLAVCAGPSMSGPYCTVTLTKTDMAYLQSIIWRKAVAAGIYELDERRVKLRRIADRLADSVRHPLVESSQRPSETDTAALGAPIPYLPADRTAQS